MAVFQLGGFGAHGQRSQLMAQADAEHGLVHGQNVFQILDDLRFSAGSGPLDSMMPSTFSSFSRSAVVRAGTSVTLQPAAPG